MATVAAQSPQSKEVSVSRHDFPYVPEIDGIADQLSKEAQEQLGVLGSRAVPHDRRESFLRDGIAAIPAVDRAVLEANNCLDEAGMPNAEGLCVFGSCAHMVGLYPGRPIRTAPSSEE